MKTPNGSMHSYLPGPGLEIFRNTRSASTFEPLVVVRNPRQTAQSMPDAQATSRDVEWIGQVRSALVRFGRRGMPGAQNAPRFDLEEAAKILGSSVDQVRELATRGLITSTWEVHEDGSREQRVRADDLAKLLDGSVIA